MFKVLIGIMLLVLVLSISGCSNKSGPPRLTVDIENHVFAPENTIDNQQNEIKPIVINIQSIDSTPYGLEVFLIVKDENGSYVNLEGGVVVRLWLQRKTGTDDAIKDYLIQEWKDIYLTQKDYDSSFGAKIDLKWDGTEGFYDTDNIPCILEIELFLSDGIILSIEEADVSIIPSCCIVE